MSLLNQIQVMHPHHQWLMFFGMLKTLTKLISFHYFIHCAVNVYFVHVNDSGWTLSGKSIRIWHCGFAFLATNHTVGETQSNELWDGPLHVPVLHVSISLSVLINCNCK